MIHSSSPLGCVGALNLKVLLNIFSNSYPNLTPIKGKHQPNSSLRKKIKNN
jgi:hypothetical protein